MSQDWYALTPRIGEETEERGGGIPTLCITEVSDLDGPRTSPGAEGTEVAMLTEEKWVAEGLFITKRVEPMTAAVGRTVVTAWPGRRPPRMLTQKRSRRCHRTEKNGDIKPSLAADRLMTDESMTLDRKSGGRTPDDDDHPGWSE